MGKHTERYYASRLALRLAVIEDVQYDRPLSGRVARRAVDSVWFERDSAVRWVDSLNVAHARPDSALRAHGAEVLGLFLWAHRMAGTMRTRDSSISIKPSNER
jgi:hypothetical protein